MALPRSAWNRTYYGASGSLSSNSIRPGLLILIGLLEDPPRTAAKHNIVKNEASRKSDATIKWWLDLALSSFPKSTVHAGFSNNLTSNAELSAHFGVMLPVVSFLSSRGSTNAPILFGKGLNCRELQVGAPCGIDTNQGWYRFKHSLFWDCIRDREKDKFVPM